MGRHDYRKLAEEGLAMPVGTDLVLHEKADRAAILIDGSRLGAVVAEAAARYQTPLAFPLMDLTVEKGAIAAALGVAPDSVESFHVDQPFAEEQARRIADSVRTAPTARMAANTEAIRYVARATDRIPVGMSIGPFSLTTKLIADPITPVFLSGSGLGADDEPEIAVLESVLAVAEAVVAESLRHQARAGAAAVFVCEPAANIAYFSPNQLAEGATTFERYALAPNRRLKALLDELGVDLIFHDCGELTDDMVRAFGALKPAILSLGSSRRLWEDASLVPEDVVLYGNLPSKKFYSDELITVSSVAEMAAELIARMRQVGHPFILGSECDVLSVAGAEDRIKAKVASFLAAAAAARGSR
ncbi:MAG: uroporphyrinogen decarboxylase family protein [Fimbriimonadaceae bacterium]